MKLFLNIYHNTLKYLVSKATTLLLTKLVEVKINGCSKKNQINLGKKLLHCKERLTASLFILSPGLLEVIVQTAH